MEDFMRKTNCCFLILATAITMFLAGCGGVSKTEAKQTIAGLLVSAGQKKAAPHMITITNSFTQTKNGETFYHFDFDFTLDGRTIDGIAVLVRRGNRIEGRYDWK